MNAEMIRSRPLKVVFGLVLAIWAVFTVFPLYWTVITAFKRPAEITQGSPSFIPWVDFTPTVDAFQSILGQGEGYGVSGMGNLGSLAKNSFLAALLSGVLAVVLGTLAAYALSRFRFEKWKNNDIAFWLISQRMFPPIALVVPYFILFNRFNIDDTLLSLVLVYTAMNLPLVVWLLRDYFRDLPVELEEASMVDGTSRFGAFFRIALPLTLPGLVVAFLFAFVFAWNEFFFAFTLTTEDAKTLPVQLAGNVSMLGPRYWDIAAQGLVIMIPPLLVALLTGRYIIRGLTLGSVKG
jgi:multiple sugar transport system permease protein